MALLGKGAIIIWNDVEAEGRADFYDWHNTEHVPERLGIPGFLRGRRCSAVDAASSPEYLTIYELADGGIATSEPYLARLDAPSPWTLRAQSRFRNTVRALTEIKSTNGAGPGGVVAAIRCAGDDAGLAVLARLQADGRELDQASRMPRITGVHLCTTNTVASAAKTTESRHRNDVIPAPAGVLLIEGCDVAAVSACNDHLRALTHSSGTAPVVGVYRLEHIMARPPALTLVRSRLHQRKQNDKSSASEAAVVPSSCKLIGRTLSALRSTRHEGPYTYARCFPDTRDRRLPAADGVRGPLRFRRRV